jgi:hypothetical protein
MVMVGNLRNRAELRRKQRRPCHHTASVLVSEKSWCPCAIADISETGARIVLASDIALPERFMLLLSRNGEARRVCRLVWRKGLIVGVEFPQPHP